MIQFAIEPVRQEELSNRPMELPVTRPLNYAYKQPSLQTFAMAPVYSVDALLIKAVVPPVFEPICHANIAQEDT